LSKIAKKGITKGGNIRVI